MPMNYDPNAPRQVMALAANQLEQERILRLSLTSRQLALNYYYSFFNAEQYDDRIVTWTGLKALGRRDLDAVHRVTSLPPGFFDGGMLFENIPLEYRKPDTEHHLVRQVVWRTTSLMFGQRTRPRLAVGTDQAATGWLDDIAKGSQLWSRLGFARNLAGAMGSAIVSFKYLAGRLVFEVHDARWCTPKIRDQSTRDVDELEIRYMYPQPTRRPDGQIQDVWFWYRRVINGESDITFQPAEVKDGDEPQWVANDAESFNHPFKFCPVRWIQNTPVLGAIDGDPDCKGAFGNVEVMDRLLSQGALGATHNADPTLHIGTSDQKLDDIKKGSKNAIRTEKDGSVQYVEMTGGGVDAAITMFDKLDTITMRAVRCILEEEREGGTMTAEEIRRRYGSMFDRIEEMQTHWSETGIVPLIEMVARSVRTVTSAGPTIAEDGTATTPALAASMGNIPPAVSSGMLDSRDMSTATVAIEVKWPELAPPTGQDTSQAATAVSVAISSRTLSRPSAVEYLAPKFGVRDTAEEIRRLEEEDAKREAATQSELLAGAETASPTGAAGGESAQDTALNGAQVDAIITIAEKSYSKGLPRSSALAIAMMALPRAPRDLIEMAIPEPALVPVPGAVPPAGPPGSPPPRPPPAPPGSGGPPSSPPGSTPPAAPPAGGQ